MCSGQPLFPAFVRILYHSRLIAWHVMGMEMTLAPPCIALTIFRHHLAYVETLTQSSNFLQLYSTTLAFNLSIILDSHRGGEGGADYPKSVHNSIQDALHDTFLFPNFPPC